MEKHYLQSSSAQASPFPSYNRTSVDITSGLTNLVLDAGFSVPTVDLCIAHLKLLRAFHQLRENVARHNGLFGIADESVTINSFENRHKAIAKIREKRWAIYVVRAVDRFERWWDTCIPQTQQPLRQDDEAHTLPDTARRMRFDSLPPLGELSYY